MADTDTRDVVVAVENALPSRVTDGGISVGRGDEIAVQHRGDDAFRRWRAVLARDERGDLGEQGVDLAAVDKQILAWQIDTSRGRYQGQKGVVCPIGTERVGRSAQHQRGHAYTRRRPVNRLDLVVVRHRVRAFGSPRTSTELACTSEPFSKPR